MSRQSKSQVRPSKKPLIYLVDDESLLLDLAEASLEPHGFRVKKFQDPARAFTTLVRSRNKPALLITDYAMGKMNGLELIEKCKGAWPSLKTILVSGTAGAEIVVNSEIRVDRFISKPYQPTTFSEMVRSVLAN